METNFKLNDDTFKTPRQMYDLDPGIADTRILVQYLSHVPLSYASSSWPGPMPMNPLENKGEGALGLWKDSSSLPKAELGAGGTVSGSRWETGAQAIHLETSTMYVSLKRVVPRPTAKTHENPSM